MSAALERTAAFVAMHIRSGLATRPTRVPPAGSPDLIEAEFARDLVEIVSGWRSLLSPLLEELPAILQSARAHRADESELLRRHVCGLDVAIENAAGSVRRWVDSDGTEGETTMRHDYGFIEGVRGADGEEVDVYLGPVADPAWVFIVHQQKKSADFAVYDEDKVMLGWGSADDAKAAYLEQYDDPRFFGGMTVMAVNDFVERLRSSTDVGALVHRLDSSPESYRVRTRTNRARSAVTSSLTRVPPVAVRTARRVASHQQQQLNRRTQAALGVVVPTLDTGLDQRIQHFIHENASLIQKLGEKTIGEIEGLIARAFTSGDGADEVAAEIARRFDIAERHARFIARDQVQRLYSQVSRMRHAELGVRAFRWITQQDTRVRDTHRVKHGRIFPYKGSRAPSFFPGDEIGCRCWEEPAFDEIKERARELVGKGRTRVI